MPCGGIMPTKNSVVMRADASSITGMMSIWILVWKKARRIETGCGNQPPRHGDRGSATCLGKSRCSKLTYCADIVNRLKLNLHGDP